MKQHIRETPIHADRYGGDHRKRGSVVCTYTPWRYYTRAPTSLGGASLESPGKKATSRSSVTYLQLCTSKAAFA
ncbi:hypothetical protein ACLKA7_007694 [Drosophila subpalustris]